MRSVFICRDSGNNDAPTWALVELPLWQPINLELTYNSSAIAGDSMWTEFSDFTNRVSLVDHLHVENKNPLCDPGCRRSFKPSDWPRAPTPNESPCRKHLEYTPRDVRPRSKWSGKWLAVLALGVLLAASVLTLTLIRKRSSVTAPTCSQ